LDWLYDFDISEHKTEPGARLEFGERLQLRNIGCESADAPFRRYVGG
jgi:hypothetical protein